MKTLIVGATGATGKQLVEQLLLQGVHVKVIVRASSNFPVSWKENNRITIIEGNILDFTQSELAAHLKDCIAVASCLGHNLTFKGMFGKPRRLVTEAVRALCKAVECNQSPRQVKFVLMNTTGNRNQDLNEKISFPQKIIIGLIRFLLPPHADNEDAADYLRTEIGQNHQFIEWCAVRPDSLLNEEEVSEYDVFPSPTRSAIFNAGKTSRINVGYFMSKLITEEALWTKWKGQMPVIYNKMNQK